MLEHVFRKHILFLDIETVSIKPDFKRLSPSMQSLWQHKAQFLDPQGKQTVEELYARAGIYAEFGKIICICVGYFVGNRFTIRAFTDDDEGKLLHDFVQMLQRQFPGAPFLMCAHNGKEFDFPYIARRLLINGFKLPALLDMAGKKPWEVRHLDTMELWKFGDWKHYTSLALLTEILGIPSPKGDIDGSQVGKVYWVYRDLARIVEYCYRDVLAVAQVFLRFQGQELLDESMIDYPDVAYGRKKPSLPLAFL
ncbi:MAG TPA: 3'-5' exonuclease [Bacteroidales bacterium]|nr:3'-5' exonuclease [Bacteroidales bacterium]